MAFDARHVVEDQRDVVEVVLGGRLEVRCRPEVEHVDGRQPNVEEGLLGLAVGRQPPDGLARGRGRTRERRRCYPVESAG